MMTARLLTRSLLSAFVVAGVVSCSSNDLAPTPVYLVTPLVTMEFALRPGATAPGITAAPSDGRFRVDLTWDDPTVDLNLYGLRRLCATFVPTACDVFASSKFVQPNHESVEYLSVRRNDALAVIIENSDPQRSQNCVLVFSSVTRQD